MDCRAKDLIKICIATGDECHDMFIDVAQKCLRQDDEIVFADTSFTLFKFCGIWRPVHWSPGWKTIVYGSYTNLMIFIVYTFTISEFVDLMGSFGNAEEFASGSFLLLSMIAVCGKTANLLKKRGAIIELMNALQKDICRPRNAEEIQLQRECDRAARFNTLWYGALTGTAVVSITVRSLVLDISQRTLPFKAWLPYNYDTSQIGFWITYFHQLVAHATAAFVNIAFDTLVPGLLRETCAQIKILKSRLYAIPRTIDVIRESRWDKNDSEYQRESQLLESELLAECVRHHLEIFQFAKTVNDIFGFTVFLQYSVSSVVICASIYQLSKMRLVSPEFIGIILYLACMLVQIFNFCFCGDEVTLQSLEICDDVYEMDWTSFCLQTKRSLVKIMLRSQRPITFTCASVIRLSLDSFSDLMKLSYSAYNVLQQSAQ